MTDQIVLLLAEDEPLIQMTVQDTLEEGGYTVVSAANGVEVLNLLEERFEDLAGMITDIRLSSGPSGWDLARRARELKPEISIVYMTGDSASEWAANGVPKSIALQKPFAPAQMLTAISTLLNQLNATGNT